MKIITNSAVSLDGKITSRDKGHVALGSAYDHEQMDKIRLQADAILVGGQTFRNWPKTLHGKSAHRQVLNVIVSHGLSLSFSQSYLADTLVKPLVITDKAVVPQNFPVECVKIQPTVTPVQVVTELDKRGVKTLLIEGGGDLIYQFIRDGLIDEMYITLCPLIFGGHDIRSLVGGEGFFIENAPRLQLLSAHPVGNEVFLHYKLETIYDKTKSSHRN